MQDETATERVQFDQFSMLIFNTISKTYWHGNMPLKEFDFEAVIVTLFQ